MPTPVRPDTYARAAGYEPQDFVEAVKSGASEYAGEPIGSWRQEGGEYLSVPDDRAEYLGISGGGSTRSNPEISGEEIARQMGQTQPLARKSTGAAIAEAAPPVSANAGAAYTGGKFADAVKEQPQIMEDVADATALLGSAGLAYAIAEEGDVLKAGAVAGGLFAVWKLIRHQTTQADRQTDMQEREHRHQIQQDRQPRSVQRGDRIPQNGNQSYVG